MTAFAESPAEMQRKAPNTIPREFQSPLDKSSTPQAIQHSIAINRPFSPQASVHRCIDEINHFESVGNTVVLDDSMLDLHSATRHQHRR